MGKLIQIDMTKPLPFNIGSWSLAEWPLDSQYFGLVNNQIGHGQTTSFTIPGKWQYVKIKFLSQSESRFDYLQVSKNGSNIYTAQSVSQNTSLTWEYSNFDGSLCDLKFAYMKDGSGTTTPDCVCIFELWVQTQDDGITQSETRYALRCADDAIYTVDATMTLVKMADTLEGIDKATWESLGANSSDLMNIRNDITGPSPKLLKYSDDIENTYLVTKNICLYPPNLIKAKRSYDFSMDYILGINNFLINQVQNDGDVLKFMISVDDGATWISWYGSAWYANSVVTDELIMSKGMTAGQMESLPTESKEVLYSTRKMMLAFLLKPGSLTSELKLNKYECKYVL